MDIDVLKGDKLMNCLFCRIIKGEIPSEKVYEDNEILGFKDIYPQAPVHILLIPKVHIASADEINIKNISYVSRIFETIPKIAQKAGIKGAYRIINNCGESAGQSVNHLHFHIMGGRNMKWPPG